MEKTIKTMDGNEATAMVAYKTNEVIAIYPITPSSTMGEHCDEWSAQKRPNLWGSVPLVIEMQSEGGAAAAVHGALQTGSLTTTFTASQGLLLMIPNMYKIAGELTPTVFHVSARAVAAQALSIFGDHSDVMATRQTGFALLASNTVQEAQDLALISQAATLQSRIPFLHFFDGFRTSSEVNKIELLTDSDIQAMIDDELVRWHRSRALSPEHPVLRGSAQNPDVYFQGRETVNPYYLACPEIVQAKMDQFAQITGRQYHLFDYEGAVDAERVIVIMGSGAETAADTAHYLAAQGEKVGVIKVHLYRPFSVAKFLDALPPTVRSIAVLDRTKEPGAIGEPLYLDVCAATRAMDVEHPEITARRLKIFGGRYGLASKEFTPAMVKAVFENLRKGTLKNHFTIGIWDDVTHTSLDFDPTFSIEPDETVRCIFWGLGSDGTVGTNKNSIKIIGEETDLHIQGYFYYDSKKSGKVTLSYLRFGTSPIRAPYLITQANFIACHQFNFIEHFDILKAAVPGATFLLNSSYGPDEVWDHLPYEAQQVILDKHIHVFVIDAHQVAQDTGMGQRINAIMQTCFFAIAGVLPRDVAIEQIKNSIRKTYGKRGELVVQQNFAAVDQALANLFEIKSPDRVTATFHRLPAVPSGAPNYVSEVLGKMILGEGDDLPVSTMPVDGTFPTATARWEKRNLALEIPVWDPEQCIQCGKCVLVCPHAAIREKVFPSAYLAASPESFTTKEAKWKEFAGMRYRLQIAPEDCTGCGLCVVVCPVKSKTNAGQKALVMADQPLLRKSETANWEYFLTLKEVDRTALSLRAPKNAALLEPLFEFSGACAGCGETPYVRLLSQLFGDRLLVANATGCSSIYGGNLPTTPWSKNGEGRGPVWSNSLFEDNAEYGLGMRLTLDQQAESSRELLEGLCGSVDPDLVSQILNADQTTDAGIRQHREWVEELKQRLRLLDDPRAKNLLAIADSLVRKSVWIIGGDGWAYDIGFGGLDHVLASGHNVKVLVLDTEVYSNTGGQASKSTPCAAIARFAANGKNLPKKDLGWMAMSYGYVYVAQVALGASDQQTLTAMLEADAYEGSSLVIAYCHCIEQGIENCRGLEQQRLAVQSGAWPLYRYNPALSKEGKNPLILDSKSPTIPLEKYLYSQNRFRMLLQSDEHRAAKLLRDAQQDVNFRWERLQYLSAMPVRV